MKVIAISSLQGRQFTVKPGETTDLEKADAERLIKLGFVKAATSASSIETTASDDGDMSAMLDAISVLDADGFGKDGKPLVKALEDILDKDITSQQRDLAWEQFNKAET
ncbi:hypothetical protein [Pseudemcibacter aquimaris]|uniref:hypothetical protein n=1 Tax=Pseudemcibacter aquimaris TaxID=2857064 RepID=UPI0020135CDD|nr:hypothetical protein [Pseudemcibacter aquimaris]MCC3862663.1 hypothetical protein [Pseudemcibacter aquimaris]WDU57814.1 hypothetical protein KW060_11460 [Pseudemcibacter aquimaris]